MLVPAQFLQLRCHGKDRRMGSSKTTGTWPPRLRHRAVRGVMAGSRTSKRRRQKQRADAPPARYADRILPPPVPTSCDKQMIKTPSSSSSLAGRLACSGSMRSDSTGAGEVLAVSQASHWAESYMILCIRSSKPRAPAVMSLDPGRRVPHWIGELLSRRTTVISRIMRRTAVPEPSDRVCGQ